MISCIPSLIVKRNPFLSSLIVLAFLVLMQPLQGYAQVDSKWSLSLYVSPAFGFRSLTNDNPSEVIIANIIEERNKSEESQFQLGSAFLVDYNVWKGLKLTTGIEYTNYGQLTRNVPFVPTQEFPLEEFEYSTRNENYDFLGIPLNFGWQFTLGSNFFITATAGFTTLYFFSYRDRLTYKYKTIDEAVEFNQSSPVNSGLVNANLWNFQLNFSLGIGRNIGENSRISIHPFYNSLAMSLTDSSIRSRYFKGGVSIGYSLVLQ